MPISVSFTTDLGPMPLILPTASGQMRVGTSSMVNTQAPLGLFSSEAILESSLLGVMPTEQVRPVAWFTACRICSASSWLSSVLWLRST